MSDKWARAWPAIVVSAAVAACAAGTAGGGHAGEEAAQDEGRAVLTGTERFDRDPHWDGHNNRATVPPPRTVKQDFGYARTSHAGRKAGEIGGFVSPAAEPAYYAKTVAARTMNDPLSASGTLTVAAGGTPDDGAGNTLIGFFNADTLNEWRTANTIALRVNGRGAGFHAHVEYATRRWRAGGDFYGQIDPARGRKVIREIPSGAVVHTWSLQYDPSGNSGGGTVTAVLDGESLTLNLDPGHKQDGATFNRFGLLNVMKSADTGGSLWLDDVAIDGALEHFDRDPGWEGFRNRRTYMTDNVRPRFNFGFSRTRHSGGSAAGEIGGLIFRGDERYPERLAYYGDRLDTLTLERPLQAAGRVCLRRGVTDSTVLIGFFHSADSMRFSTAQVSGIPENFVGVAIEGPSREGFFFYPVYGVNREGVGGSAHGTQPTPPYIYPDGKSHRWTLEYLPAAADGAGRITVSLDDKPSRLDLAPGHKAIGARFNRFGIVTTHIDGNGQHVYVDDLSYTSRQAAL